VITAPHNTEPLDAALRRVHAAWTDEARRFLEPALAPGTDFYTRWAAVRYLDDDFREHYRRERALVDELRPFLQPEEWDRLVRSGERLLRSRLELDRIGRRRGTATEFAAGGRDLLEQLAVWCAEIEVAARPVTRDDLPAEGADLLTHLEALLPTR
jgi:hypothetical protein